MANKSLVSCFLSHGVVYISRHIAQLLVYRQGLDTLLHHRLSHTHTHTHTHRGLSVVDGGVA